MKNIILGILNHNRYDLFKRTMQSLIESGVTKRNDVKLILWDNNSDGEIKSKIRKEFGHVFSRIMFHHENAGIGGGMNGLHNNARNMNADYYIHVENDWMCDRKDSTWIDDCLEIFDSQISVGIIKLRAKDDGQYEMQGQNYPTVAMKYSPWWVEPIPSYVKSGSTNSGHHYYYAFVTKGYSNNPHILRMEMVKDWIFDSAVKGKGLEEEKMEDRPAQEDWSTCQYSDGIFHHIG